MKKKTRSADFSADRNDLKIDVKTNFAVIMNAVIKNFSGSNTNDSFTTAVSNSFFSPSEKNPLAADVG